MRRGLIISAIGVGVAGAASAADWTIAPSAALQEVITDNVFNDSVKQEADAVTQLEPGLDITGQGGHTQVGISYHPVVSAYLLHGSQDRVDQNLLGHGTLSPLDEDLVDLSFNTFATNTSANGSFVTPGAGGLVPKSDRVTDFGGSAGPRIQERFGDIAVLTASYTVGSSNTSGAGASSRAGALSNNLLQQTEQATLASGDLFNNVTSQLSASRNEGSGSGINSKYTLDSDLVSLQYHINHEYALTGSAGYEKTDYAATTLSQGFNSEGLQWSVGFQATPNDVTQLSLSYGKQQGSYNVSGHLTYDLDDRMFLSSSYTVGVQTQLQSTLQNLQNLTQNPQGAFVNSQTQLPFTPVNQAFGAFNYLSRSKTFQISATRQFKRSSVTLSVTDQRLDALNGTTGSNETWGTTATYTEELTPYLNGNLDAGYNETKFAANTIANQNVFDRYFNADASLTFHINETLSANVRYSFFRRLSTLGFRGETTDSILIGLSKVF